MRSDVNTPLPPLDEIKTVVDNLATDAELPLDVHTVILELNGQHGGFDLTLKATDSDMQDWELTGILGSYGAVMNLTEKGA